jgi:hypothetical protein
MNYAHVQLSTGAVLAVAPLPRELFGLAQVSLNSIQAAVDPCPPAHLDRGYLNRAGLTDAQLALLTSEQTGSLAP